MDEIINKIISIDKETVKMKLKTEEIIRGKEKELKETLQELEKKYTEEGRLEGEKTYNEIIRNGEAEIERLKSQDIETLERIDNVYKGSKFQLIEDLWNSLFIGEE